MLERVAASGESTELGGAEEGGGAMREGDGDEGGERNAIAQGFPADVKPWNPPGCKHELEGRPQDCVWYQLTDHSPPGPEIMCEDGSLNCECKKAGAAECNGKCFVAKVVDAINMEDIYGKDFTPEEREEIRREGRQLMIETIKDEWAHPERHNSVRDLGEIGWFIDGVHDILRSCHNQIDEEVHEVWRKLGVGTDDYVPFEPERYEKIYGKGGELERELSRRRYAEDTGRPAWGSQYGAGRLAAANQSGEVGTGMPRGGRGGRGGGYRGERGEGGRGRGGHRGRGARGGGRGYPYQEGDQWGGGWRGGYRGGEGLAEHGKGVCWEWGVARGGGHCGQECYQLGLCRQERCFSIAAEGGG